MAAADTKAVSHAPATLPLNAERLSSRTYAFALAAIALLHLSTGIWFHYDRSFLGDEWGSYGMMAFSYRDLLSMFRGWATMNFYLAGLKPIYDHLGGRNWLLVIPGLLGSCWLVVLSGMFARKLGGSRGAALLAALLVGTSPFLVYYSVIIRSYSILAALCLAMTIALFNWRTSGRWRDGILCGLSAAGALLAHLNAVYSFMGVGLLAVWWTLLAWRRNEPEPLRRLVRLVVPLCFLVALAAAAHIPMYDEIVAFRQQWKGSGSLVPTWLPAAVNLMFGRDMKYAMLILLAFAAVHSLWYRTSVRWLILLLIVPIVGLTAARLSHVPGAYARFLIPSIPIAMIAIGLSLAALPGRWGKSIAIAATVVLITCGTVHTLSLKAYIMQVPFHKIAAEASVDPQSQNIIIGPPIHRYGFSQLMKFDAPAIAALKKMPQEQVGRVMLAEGYALTNPIDAKQLSQFRVARLTGTPKEIGNQLADLMLARLRKPTTPEMKKDLINELSPLLEWLGRPEEARRLK